jgi:hypothetical protein
MPERTYFTGENLELSVFVVETYTDVLSLPRRQFGVALARSRRLAGQT